MYMLNQNNPDSLAGKVLVSCEVIGNGRLQAIASHARSDLASYSPLPVTDLESVRIHDSFDENAHRWLDAKTRRTFWFQLITPPIPEDICDRLDVGKAVNPSAAARYIMEGISKYAHSWREQNSSPCKEQ